MKKECSQCCLTCPVLALWLLRIIVAVIFIMAGVGKVIDMSGFQSTIEGIGYPVAWAAVVAYFVVAAEILGGLALLCQKWIPKCIGKILILLILPVIGGMLFHIYLPAKDMMQILLHVQLGAAVYALASLCPKCPIGLSGCKTMTGGACPVKKKK